MIVYTEMLKNVCSICGHKYIESYFATKKLNWNGKKFSNFYVKLTY